MPPMVPPVIAAIVDHDGLAQPPADMRRHRAGEDARGSIRRRGNGTSQLMAVRRPGRRREVTAMPGNQQAAQAVRREMPDGPPLAPVERAPTD